LLFIAAALIMSGRPRSLTQGLKPGDKACLVVWLTTIGLATVSLGALELERWHRLGAGLSPCVEVEQSPGTDLEELFGVIGSLPWRQLGKSLASFSGVWPIYLALLQHSRRGRLAFEVCILSFVVLATLVTPVAVFDASVATPYYYTYAVRCLFCLSVNFGVPVAFFAASVRKWGLSVADPTTTFWHWAACLALLAGALFACRNEFSVIFEYPLKAS